MQKLDKAKGKWEEKLLRVLWAYKTTKHVLTGETPFSLVYEIEIIISINISIPTLWVEGVVQDQNDTLLHLMLDHSKKRRQQAQICTATYQQQIRATHHKKVKSREFQIRELVLKRVIQSTRQKDQEKLGPNWEDPCIIIARGAKESYTLDGKDENQLNK